jgi:hypothetical protein
MSAKIKAKPEKAPSYYDMDADFTRGGAPGWKFLNHDTVQKGHKGICPVPPWPTGQKATKDGPWRFPDFVETPRFLFDRKFGRRPRDVENIDGFWVVSEKMKTVLETTAPGACAFRSCETVLASGDPGPARWLCTIARAFLDAVDLEVTEGLLSRRNPNGSISYTPTPLTKLRFKHDVVGGAHLFHVVDISSRTVYCDQVMKDACKAAGLKGIRFVPIVPKYASSVPAPEPDTDISRGSKHLIKLGNHLLGFGDKTNSASLAVAARAALRAIPLLERLSWDKPLRKRMRASLGRERMSNSAIVLGTLRSAATVWVAAQFPAFGTSERFHAIKHDVRIASGSEDAGRTPAALAAYAAHEAMITAINVFDGRRGESNIGGSRKQAALFASMTVTSAAIGFLNAYDPEEADSVNALQVSSWRNRDLSRAERAVWEAAWDDVRELEGNGHDIKALLAQPLWINSSPDDALDDWRKLSTRLQAMADRQWDVWTDWYEKRLNGISSSEQAEIFHLSLPDEVWSAGVIVVDGHAPALVPSIVDGEGSEA